MVEKAIDSINYAGQGLRLPTTRAGLRKELFRLLYRRLSGLQILPKILEQLELVFETGAE